jgi:hypothetical protein
MKRFSLAFLAPGWLLVGALVASLTVACGADSNGGADRTNDSCELGSEGCECTKGSACDDGLTCLSKLCVVKPGPLGGGTATGGGGNEGGEGITIPIEPEQPEQPQPTPVPTSACADAGESCLQNADCCQTGSKVGPQGATCLSDDFVCHAKCTANSQCGSGCCAALQGTNFGACAAAAYCAPPPSSGGGGGGCSSDVQCLPSHRTPGCSYACYNQACVEQCNF